MGTMVGVPPAQKRPVLFETFVCTDLYADMHANETVGYQQTLDRLREAGDTKALARLAAIGGGASAWEPKAWEGERGPAPQNAPVTPHPRPQPPFPPPLPPPPPPA